MTKVLVFGIDGASPELIFDKWSGELPNITKLRNAGAYACLNSSIPPSTIIAWHSMFSGKDASELGYFSHTYKDKEGKTKLVSSNNVNAKMIWDILSENEKKVITLYEPMTYPVKEINGIMVSGFISPGLSEKSAYPPAIVDEISKLGNKELFFDVAVAGGGYKALEADELLKKTYEMTDMQLKLLMNHIHDDWELFIAVMIGTDRLQHMLWRHFDQTHRRAIKDSPHKNALLDYYKHLDRKLGEILKELDEDTVVIVASDHGMVKQEGKININNWLMKEGYLVLKEEIKKEVLANKTRFSTDFVDMDKTLAYGGGAYNARVTINKKKAGKNYIKVRDELIEKLKRIPGDHGEILDTKVFKKEDVYVNPGHPEAPDLTIYFDNLRWASNPDFGHEGLYSWETAVGADNAGHATKGCFIISGKGIPKKGKIDEIDIRQVMPTILSILKVSVPKDVRFRSIELR